MIIDPSTNIGKLRLKIGDTNDLILLPDTVLQQTLTDNDNNVNRSAKVCAGYIAAILSQRTHERLNFIEIWGSEAYKNYMDYIKNIMLNPNMSDVSPIPYGAGTSTTNPIMTFNTNWTNAYSGLTADETLALIAGSEGV